MPSITREEIYAYAEDQFGALPEYLWAKYPAYSVLRCTATKKWFAALLDVPADKLGLPGEAVMEILDIKCNPLMLGSLLEMPGILPGYHMNKNSWVTVLLDGSVPRDQVFALLDMSYDLVKPKTKRKPKA